MLDHAASVEVNLLDDGIDRYHCPIDSSLRVWSDCTCVSHSIHRIQLNRICATDSSLTWSPPCQSKAAKLPTVARPKSTFSMRVISRSIPLRTASRSWQFHEFRKEINRELFIDR